MAMWFQNRVTYQWTIAFTSEVVSRALSVTKVLSAAALFTAIGLEPGLAQPLCLVKVWIDRSTGLPESVI